MLRRSGIRIRLDLNLVIIWHIWHSGTYHCTTVIYTYRVHVHEYPVPGTRVHQKKCVRYPGTVPGYSTQVYLVYRTGTKSCTEKRWNSHDKTPYAKLSRWVVISCSPLASWLLDLGKFWRPFAKSKKRLSVSQSDCPPNEQSAKNISVIIVLVTEKVYLGRYSRSQCRRSHVRSDVRWQRARNLVKLLVSQTVQLNGQSAKCISVIIVLAI